MEVEQTFKIIISKDLNERLDWLVNNYAEEIGAWLVGEVRDGNIYIEDFLVPEQEVTKASVDTDTASLIKLRKEHGDKCLKIIGHWHSHNTMSSYWSSTDETFIEEFMGPRDFAIFMVSSVRDGHRVRLETKKPIKLKFDECDFEVEYGEKLGKEMEKIIKEKVKAPKPIDNFAGFDDDDEDKDDQNGNLYDDYKDTAIPDLVDKMITIDYQTREVTVHDVTPTCALELQEHFDDKAIEHAKKSGRNDLIFGFKKAKRVTKFAKQAKGWLIQRFTDKLEAILESQEAGK